MARQPKLTPEELALIKAQTQRLGAETGQAATDSAQKAQLVREQISADALINASKIGLGQQEIGSKDRQSALAGALEALGQSSKEGIATRGDESVLLTDLSKNPNIDKGTLATAMAYGGHPELFNALATEKAAQREKLISSTIPLLQAASSDAEREKKIKPTLEATFPGSYKEALARAYPKAGQPTPTAAPAELFKGGPPTGGEHTNPLVGQLLTAAGFGGGNNVNGVVNPPAPEINYTGIGRGALEGAKRTDLASGRSELATPSGGTIGFNTPKSDRGNELLANLISPRTVAPAPNVAVDEETPSVPALQTKQQSPTTIPFDKLLVNNSTALPTPTPTPLISPTGTPLPQATPSLTPMTPAMLAALRKRAGY